VIVVDTNVISYLLITGDFTKEAEAVFRKDPEWAAPLLWRSEFRNVLAFYLRRNHMLMRQSVDLMEEAEYLMRNREFGVSSARVLRLTAESGCSAYDCEFVALAMDLGFPLVTSDAKVLKAFPRLAFSIDDFA